MAAKKKVSDEQIIEKLQNPELSYKQIADELEIKWAGSSNNRCKQLAKNNSLPERIPALRGNPNWRKDKDVAPPEPHTDHEPKPVDRFPFVKSESVIFGGFLHTVSSVGNDRMILCRNATLRSVTIMLDDYVSGKVEIRRTDEKPENTYERINRNHRPDEEPNEETLETEGLFEPPELPDEPEEEMITAIESAPSSIEPFNLDMEMESITDESDQNTRFEPIDYTDEDWLVIPAKGTIERRIWEKAKNEIDEYHNAKQEVEMALLSGGRLPTQTTDRYNRIVSKYGEGVGA